MADKNNNEENNNEEKKEKTAAEMRKVGKVFGFVLPTFDMILWHTDSDTTCHYADLCICGFIGFFLLTWIIK